MANQVAATITAFKRQRAIVARWVLCFDNGQIFRLLSPPVWRLSLRNNNAKKEQQQQQQI